MSAASRDVLVANPEPTTMRASRLASEHQESSMVVGILQVELTIDGATCLKDKRRVVSSLKDRLHREHQVSVAEVEALDDCRVARLGITMASNSVPHCQSVLDGILDKLRRARDCFVSDHNKQILSGQ